MLFPCANVKLFLRLCWEYLDGYTLCLFLPYRHRQPEGPGSWSIQGGYLCTGQSKRFRRHDLGDTASTEEVFLCLLLCSIYDLVLFFQIDTTTPVRMTRKYLKHLVLFFLSASAIESAIDTSNPPVYREEDYEDLGLIVEGGYGAVSKVREKKTGKIYALKTYTIDWSVYAHAENEVIALRQLDHENIIKMVACSDMGNRREEDPVHIVLEHMPCDLYQAIKNHPEIKENRREILHQILKGVAHIHSKKLAHKDLVPRNVLIDSANMSVKICDFGFCFDVEIERLSVPKGLSMDGYYKDILFVVHNMVFLYLWEMFPDSDSLGVFSIDEVESFFEAQRKGGKSNNEIGEIYKEMKKVVSEKGLDLFRTLLASERIGGCTAAAEALKHPFFAEGREQDPLREEPKRRRLCSR
ncbi:MAG: CMGC/CDK protein kinase [Amphiamblys sp. WSBS2006]|nr:MAG: CMGC/CDK protein kinase [Amphiamblys sp. WSBS2006]